MPAIMAAFSMEECVSEEAYATRFSLDPNKLEFPLVFFSLAAIKAHRDALDAVSCITPPPLLSDKNVLADSTFQLTNQEHEFLILYMLD